MSRYTFLRVEVDSDVVERVLGLIPGVEVVETLDGAGEDAPVSSPVEDEPQGGPAADESEDGGVLGDVTPDDELVAEGSPLREYGLLGLGVSFVMLGLATVGIWWYRRRSGGESGDAETPPPATEFDTPDEPVTPAPSTTESDDGSSESATEGTDDLSLDLDGDADGADSADADDRDESDTEPTGRREDREDVEWAPKWDDSPPEPSVDADAVEDEDEDEDKADGETDEPRPGESVDAAPLLGIAFIAITGAIVRWAQGGTDGEQ